MRRRATIGVLLLILVLAGTTACNPFGGDKEESSEQLAEVVRGNITASVSGSGNMEASREVSLTFGSGGKIDKIYVKEGDEVSKGEVLANLDADSLKLARTQAQVALTQAQLTWQTAEYELDTTLDKKDTLELALLNAQINLDQAQYNLEQTQDLYTWSDIKIAQANVDESERYLEYALKQLYKYLPLTEEGSYPKIEDDFPKTEGYKVWQDRIVHAQSRLNAAKDRLKAMQSGRDTEEVAIKKLQVDAAEMALAQAQKNLDELTEEVAIKELQVEFAKDSVGLAEQSVKNAQKNIDEATISAPFDGVVASVDVEEGDTVTTAITIVHLIDPTGMELIVELDEIDIPGVKLNQRVIIEVDALPALPFEGEVTFISSLGREEAGVVLYEVKISLAVPQGARLMIGMSTDADIIINERSNVLLVPDRAIKQDSQGNPMVEVIVNGDIEERRVVEGVSDGFDTEIVSGLSEGEVVVVGKRAK